MADYLHEGDTIAAISTAPGEGGIGIVRASGPGAFGIAGKIFCPASGGGLVPRRVTYGHIIDPVSGERVDEVLAAYLKAPHTYTREDVVEISCHGGIVPLRRVLALMLEYGARPAEPGEFTRRAFLAGRIDLAQAEAALDIIRAKTDAAEQLALEQLEGGLSRKVNGLREQVTNFCAHVEAYIDFPEDEIEPSSLHEIRTGIEKVSAEVRSLVESFHEGRLYREGLRVAIVGRPNVGKSSLLNALIERDRAIVTELPGTTRDVIEEYLNIKGLPVKVMDTAGIREAHDMAEAEGVRRSLRAIEDADVVVGVLDASGPLHDEDREVIGKVEGLYSILVLNKADLGVVLDEKKFSVPAVKVSAKQLEGIEALREMIHDRALGSAGSKGAEGVVITNLRHKSALDESLKGLDAAHSSLDVEPLEITALELRSALDALGRIVGAVTTDDILNRIFSSFCIGK